MKTDPYPIKKLFVGAALIAASILSSSSINAQQHIIANKDNTRPQATAYNYIPAHIASFTATKWNGYNEIEWSALRQEQTRRYVIEYSTNGIDFLSAGEMNTGAYPYLFKHVTPETRPILYRLKIETMNGKHFYSPEIFLEGEGFRPVILYPTILTTNMLNLNTSFPVERVHIISSSGAQVFSKEIGGQRDNISMSIPASLAKGQYYLVVFGKNWKTTEKFMIQ